MDLQPQPGKRTVKASAPLKTPGDPRIIRGDGENDGFDVFLFNFFFFGGGRCV